jgi:hypothetical protein
MKNIINHISKLGRHSSLVLGIKSRYCGSLHDVR